LAGRSRGQSDPLALSVETVERAIAAGAAEAEATLTIVERFSVSARGAITETLEQSTGRSLMLRVIAAGGKKATLVSSDLSSENLAELVRNAVDAARFVGADPFVGLPETSSPPSPDATIPGMYDSKVRERASEAKIDDALALEATARGVDARIVNSGGSRVVDSVGTIALSNSKGFRGTYQASQALRDTEPIAQDGENKRIGHYGSAARGYSALESVDSIARTAAHRALDFCGARKPQTMRCPVIFERDVAAYVLSDVFSALNAQNVAIGNSFLIGKVGTKIGSEVVNVCDDGTLPEGLGTSPFDAEGVPMRRTVVFRRGVLETFLYDTYYGRKLGAASTANAAGGGIGANNFYLEPGKQTLEELIAATKRGILIVDTIGFAHESASGTYSRGARGFLIENGERAHPVDEFTVAGNLLEMLAGLDGIANDLRFDGTIVSPSFRISEMTISGG
jgi:PmbA protein